VGNAVCAGSDAGYVAAVAGDLALVFEIFAAVIRELQEGGGSGDGPEGGAPGGEGGGGGGFQHDIEMGVIDALVPEDDEAEGVGGRWFWEEGGFGEEGSGGGEAQAQDDGPAGELRVIASLKMVPGEDDEDRASREEEDGDEHEGDAGGGLDAGLPRSIGKRNTN
jgi:hypothetical protein